MKKTILLLLVVLLLCAVLSACTENDRNGTETGTLPVPENQTQQQIPSNPSGGTSQPSASADDQDVDHTGEPVGTGQTNPAETEPEDQEMTGLPVENDIEIVVTGNVEIGGN